MSREKGPMALQSPVHSTGCTELREAIAGDVKEAWVGVRSHQRPNSVLSPQTGVHPIEKVALTPQARQNDLFMLHFFSCWSCQWPQDRTKKQNTKSRPTKRSTLDSHALHLLNEKDKQVTSVRFPWQTTLKDAARHTNFPPVQCSVNKKVGVPPIPQSKLL